LYKLRNKKGLRFAELIDKVSHLAPEVRFRFTSPHPKDFPSPLIEVIKSNYNICKQIHMPAQSGNSKVLKDMRRYYTREAYLELVDFIRSEIPRVALSSDFISGFCGETEEEFKDTLTLLELVKFDVAFLFMYSMREKTHAYHNLNDDVDPATKKRRLQEMIDVFRKHQLEVNRKEIGAYHLVLIENVHRKDKNNFVGRTDTNKLCVFRNDKILSQMPLDLKYSKIDLSRSENLEEMKIGDYVVVKIDDCSNNTLYATAISKVKRMSDFFIRSENQPYILLNH
jgi:MiaB/RimO family radical SAM methylthiotransferase